jgi:hypothetical protein
MVIACLLLQTFLSGGIALAQTDRTPQNPPALPGSVSPSTTSTHLPKAKDTAVHEAASDGKQGDTTITVATISFFATIFGALIGALSSYVLLRKQVNENTRLALEQLRAQAKLGFVQVIFANNVYRDTIKGFIERVNLLEESTSDSAFSDLKKTLHDPAFFYLFLLKKERKFDELFNNAIRTKDIDYIKDLTKELLSVT